MNVMLCDEGGGGVQNRLKMRDVICECSPWLSSIS